MVNKNYETNDFSKADYIRRTKTKSGSYEYIYHFVYSHFEDNNTTHIKDPNKPEWIRKLKDGRAVYYEDLDKRERICLDESKIGKAGRPKGSKDSFRRKRNNKKGE